MWVDILEHGRYFLEKDREIPYTPIACVRMLRCTIRIIYAARQTNILKRGSPDGLAMFFALNPLRNRFNINGGVLVCPAKINVVKGLAGVITHHLAPRPVIYN